MSWHRKSSEKTEHGYVEARLSAYLDGELSPQERAAVDRHLAGCQACRWNLETLRQTVQWTHELPPVPVPRVFTVPAPAKPARARQRRWSFVPLLQGATALVALLLVFVVGGDVLLSGSRLASAPAPAAMWEEAPADAHVVERVENEAEVVLGVQAVEATVVVEMEKAVEAEPPSEPSLPPKEEPASAPPGVEQEDTLAAGGETGVAGGEAPEAEGERAPAGTAPRPSLALTVTQTYTPTRFFAAEPSAQPTGAAKALGTRAPTPAPLPTQAPAAEAVGARPTLIAAEPTVAPPPPQPTEMPRPAPTRAPTVVVKAQEGRELLALDEAQQAVVEQPGGQRQTSLVTWFRGAEITLGILLVLLALITIATMVARRRA